ncbi:ATP-binding protein [Leptolyngbyaceae cyanobacterium UHCC 1019]
MRTTRLKDTVTTSSSKVYGCRSDAASQRFLNIILQSALRAGAMVDDLLEFSKMGRAELRWTTVQMNILVQQVQQQLQPEMVGRSLRWQIAPLPEVQGDPAMLRLVWQNLLSKAIKYTRDRSEAVITIGSSNHAQETVFFVQDNGAGFDMKYRDRLFNIFQRFPTVAFPRAICRNGDGIGKRAADYSSAWRTHLSRGRDRSGRNHLFFITKPGRIGMRLRFLLLEDNPLDAEMIGVTLLDGGVDCELCRVDTRSSFISALETNEFDLILADYALPAFDGASALEIARNLRPDIPFIFVSASMGEELAIEALKRGATDYVLKQRLGRLVFSVQRALREAQERRDRQQAEAALQQSETRLRKVAANLPNGAAFIVDHELRYLLAEGEALRNAGFTSEDLVGKTLWEAIDPDLATQYESYYRQALAGEHYSLEHRSHDRDYITHGTPLYNDQGNVEAALSVSYDISDRKRIEESLRESESRLKLMIESAREYAIFTLDLEGRITSWNSGAQGLVGYTEAEILGQSGQIIFTPEDNAQGKAEREMHLAQTEGQAENRRWHVRKNGSRFWGTSFVMPLRNGDNMLHGYIKIMRDETSQRQAEERFQTLYDTTSDLLATEQPLTLMHNLFRNLSTQLELDYYFNYMVEERDDFAKQTLRDRSTLHLKNYQGLEADEAQAIEWLEFGQSLCGLVAQEQQQIVLDHDQIALHPQAQLYRSLRVTAYAGQPLIVQGRLLGTLCFASRTRTHFTPDEASLLQSVCDQMAIALERTHLLNSIQQQADQLQRANQIKDEFLAVLSHELRSPLNPILGWSKLLQQGNLDSTKTKIALATIDRNAQIQVQLIDDLLDVSRILRGKLSLNTLPVDLSAVISAALETVYLAAEAKSLQIQVAISPDVGAVLGDAGRLQQVVWNLLSNAVKFTQSGGQVTIALTQTATDAQIAVSDTGKGIKPEFLPYVFEHFRQEDGATTRKFGGLGLGLAIARQIVEMHGGQIFVDSPGDGQGTTFTVQLPLASHPNELPSAKASSPAMSDLNGIRILVVDDETDSREVVTFVLEQAGAIVTSISSGIEALQAFEESIEKSIPDLIVSDIGMPEMDGYMLLQHIRAIEQGTYIPAIALTAYAGEYEQKRAIAAGFQQHISKPVDPETLVSALRTWCSSLSNSGKR